MKFILALCSVVVFSVACSSPKEKLVQREVRAQEEYDQGMQQAQEDYSEDKKEEAKDYIDESDDARVDKTRSQIQVDD